MRKILEKIEQRDTVQVNKLNVNGFITYHLIQLVFAVVKFNSGEASLMYAAGFGVCFALTAALIFLEYRRDKGSQRIKGMVTTCFIILYLFVMLAGSSAYRFAFIFPPLCVLVLYHSFRLMLYVAVSTISVNVLNTLVCYFVLGRTNYDDIIRYVIQIFTVVTATMGACVASRIYSVSFQKTLSQTEQLQDMTLETIETIANTIDAKDPYTQGHSRRVSEYSVKIAGYMGMSQEEQDIIRYVGLLHDVGKIAVPDIVLNKPSRLTDEEYGLLKMHSVSGGDILKNIRNIPNISEGARYHHERYDGRGYPDGISGEDIPLYARIISLADAFDAMTSNRVYRKHLSLDVVMEEIRKGRGTQFDPDCVDAFLAFLEKEGFPEDNDAHAASESPDSAEKGSGAENGISPDDLDQLTGVLNRIAGERKLSELLKERTGTVILLNITGLKEINLEYGYRRGDHYLKFVARMLTESGDDMIIARFGGGEFIAFLPDITDRDQVSEWMKKFIGRMNDEENRDDLIEKRLGTSCGLSIHSGTSMELQEHIVNAEKALYHLKRTGDNEFAFYEHTEKAGDEFLRGDDIQDLVKAVREACHSMDPAQMDVMENDFLNTITSLRKKGCVKAALMLFSVRPTRGDEMDTEHRTAIMGLLEEAMFMAEGKRENISYYSSMQRVYVLEQAKDGAGDSLEELAGRIQKSILTAFYKMYDKNDVEVGCSMSIEDLIEDLI